MRKLARGRIGAARECPTEPGMAGMATHYVARELHTLGHAVGELNRAIDAGYRTFLSYGYLAGAEAARDNDASATRLCRIVNLILGRRFIASAKILRAFSRLLPA